MGRGSGLISQQKKDRLEPGASLVVPASLEQEAAPGMIPGEVLAQKSGDCEGGYMPGENGWEVPEQLVDRTFHFLDKWLVGLWKTNPFVGYKDHRMAEG